MESDAILLWMKIRVNFPGRGTIVLVPTLDNLRNFFLRLPKEMLTFFQKSQEAR